MRAELWCLGAGRVATRDARGSAVRHSAAQRQRRPSTALSAPAAVPGTDRKKPRLPWAVPSRRVDQAVGPNRQVGPRTGRWIGPDRARSLCVLVLVGSDQEVFRFVGPSGAVFRATLALGAPQRVARSGCSRCASGCGWTRTCPRRSRSFVGCPCARGAYATSEPRRHRLREHFPRLADSRRRRRNCSSVLHNSNALLFVGLRGPWYHIVSYHIIHTHWRDALPPSLVPPPPQRPRWRGLVRRHRAHRVRVRGAQVKGSRNTASMCEEKTMTGPAGEVASAGSTSCSTGRASIP